MYFRFFKRKDLVADNVRVYIPVHVLDVTLYLTKDVEAFEPALDFMLL